MADPSWSKEVAKELLDFGYKLLSKRYHPDVGGSHDEMLTLGATRDYLLRCINGETLLFLTPEPAVKRAHKPRGGEAFKDDDDEYCILREWSQNWLYADNVRVQVETEKAVKVKIPGIALPMWFPKSQLHVEDNECWEADDVGVLVMSKWIAEQKGLA